MWVGYFFVSYLALALAVPVCWALVPLWRRAGRARYVGCPAASQIAMVRLDPWYAVRMHALGDRELRVIGCSQWPQRCDCGQDCLVRIGVV
jgi:hypothetical protein